jgi:hypothetical protein
LMRVEAGNVAARAIFQGAAPLRMALGSGHRRDETEGSHTSERSTGGDQEVATGKFMFSTYSISDHLNLLLSSRV